MKTCPSCGAKSQEDAAWCSQCYARFEAAAEAIAEPTPEAVVYDPFRKPDAMAKPGHVRYSRWANSETTMGPFGRVATSIALLLPFWLFFQAGVMGIVGLALWVVVVMPMALRSIWKRVPVIEDYESEG